jgi:hypothetical protein
MLKFGLRTQLRFAIGAAAGGLRPARGQQSLPGWVSSRSLRTLGKVHTWFSPLGWFRAVMIAPLSFCLQYACEK